LFSSFGVFLMSVSKIPELEWERAPLGALVRLSWPIVVSMLSVSTMTLVDTLFVSRLGPAAVAGVGLAGVLTFCLWCFPMGLIRAVKILVSQSVGAGNRGAFRPYLVAALALAAGFGVLATIAGQILAPLLPTLTATPESGAFAGQYLSLRVLGSVPILLLIAVQEARQGFGDSRTMMFTTLFGNALNIGLDYLFIFVFDWGVRGAGAASSLALLFELIAVVAVHAWRDGFFTRETRRHHFRELWNLGLPSGIQFGLEVSSFGLMVLILSAFSELHTAAHQIAIQVLHFAFLPAFAFGEAGSVLAGQAVGAMRPSLIGRVAKLTLWLALSYATICGLVLFFGAQFIVGAFTKQADLFELTAQLFTIIAVFQFVDAANLVGRAVLRGTGDVRFVAYVGIISAWICTPPMTYLLGYCLGWGVYGAWVGLSGEVLVVTFLYWRRLGRKYWDTSPLPAPSPGVAST
jgi:multidrug resistance protein, MATE family